MKAGIQGRGHVRGAKARQPRVLSRGVALVLSLLQGGCLFFGVEAQECADDRGGANCESGDGDTGGTDAAGGNGSGGRIDDSTGGSSQGGSDPIGGSAGLGGDPTAGNGGESPSGGNNTGGLSTGGVTSGGGAGGGAAGGESGGSGGDAAGGQGSGGSSEVAELAATLRINEVFHSNGGYVELFNLGDESIALADIAVATAMEGESDADLDTACDLSTAVEISPQDFLVVQAADVCSGSGACLLDCTFVLAPGSRVFLLKLIDSNFQTVNYEDYPSPPPFSGESYQAVPDGGALFFEQILTPGESNSP